jgi:cytochrome c-type biogenesis protein CcmH/NrfG
VADAQRAIDMDPANPKGYYRLATARSGLKEFDEALSALKACEMTCGVTPDTSKLREDIVVAKAAFHSSEKAKFAKMFQ